MLTEDCCHECGYKICRQKYIFVRFVFPLLKNICLLAYFTYICLL